ncbi:molybdate ABC transporter substrate-binding protein [Rodentibacter caecimuris]|uniref:Molybdate ABC transporter substrate-binding protein n=1 Tax=Rodentibacter caecimuris TaxID=1796644 RepID=A0ABX3KZ08_9PAST|nr:molybdate ABC transporter substrate-binding protein [Rodentibacter heylii]
MKRTLSILTALLSLFSASITLAADKITVFAAASMSDALQRIADQYQQENTANKIVFSFASSSTLAKQIEQGAPADLFVSANTKWMNYLSEKGLTVKDSEKILVGNKLVLITPVQSAVKSVDILKGQWLDAEGYLSVGDPSHVPAGQYAQEALTKLNLWDKANQKLARAKDVRAALALVERGETAYGIVYGTDAKVSDKVRIVATFPQSSYKAIEYPVAIIKDHNNADVQNFLRYLQSDKAKTVFEKYGFSTK